MISTEERKCSSHRSHINSFHVYVGSGNWIQEVSLLHNLILSYTRLGAHWSQTAGWTAGNMLHGADHHGSYLCDATSPEPTFNWSHCFWGSSGASLHVGKLLRRFYNLKASPPPLYRHCQAGIFPVGVGGHNLKGNICVYYSMAWNLHELKTRLFLNVKSIHRWN